MQKQMQKIMQKQMKPSVHLHTTVRTLTLILICNPHSTYATNGTILHEIMLRGEPKSGTTYVEFFMHHLMALICMGTGRNLKFGERQSTCSWGKEQVEFHVRDKHTLLDTGVPIQNITRNCIGMPPHEIMTKCVYPVTGLPQRDFHNYGPGMILVLREPLDVLQSQYYHNTPTENLSQYGLEQFVVGQAAQTFADIAVLYMTHQQLAKKNTILWIYPYPPPSIGTYLSKIFNIASPQINYFIKAANTMAERDYMLVCQELGGVPQGSAHNLKVRKNKSLVLTQQLRKMLIQKYNATLPHNLSLLWYGSPLQKRIE